MSRATESTGHRVTRHNDVEKMQARRRRRQVRSRSLQMERLESRRLLDATLLNDTFNSFPSYAEFFGSAHHHSGYIGLTDDGQANARGTIILNSPGRPLTNFHADFAFSMWGSGPGADGMVFGYAPKNHYGHVGHIQDAPGLFLWVDTFDNGNGTGVGLNYDKSTRAFTSIPVSQVRGLNQRATVTVNADGSGTMFFNWGQGTTTKSFTLPGWTSSKQPQSDWVFFVSAGTGGAANDHQELEYMFLEDRTDPPSISATIFQSAGGLKTSVPNGGTILDSHVPSFQYAISDNEGDVNSISARVDFVPSPGNPNPPQNNINVSSSPSDTILPSRNHGPGVYTLRVAASDRSQRSANATFSYTLVDDDDSPPIVVLNGSNGVEGHAQTQFFSWTTTDASGIASTNVQLLKDGVPVSPLPPIVSGPGPNDKTLNFDALGVGLFTIRVSATDADNDRTGDSRTSATVEQTVLVTNAAPVAFAGFNQTVKEGQQVAFDGTESTDADGDALTYQWDFGDGSFGSGPRPTHGYGDQGTYRVTLTVNDGIGGVSSHALDVTALNLPPRIDAVHNSGPGFPGDTINVQVVASDVIGDPLTYEFDFDGDGLFEVSGHENMASRAYASPGVFPVNVRVTDGDGGVDTAYTAIEIGAPPPVIPIVNFTVNGQVASESGGNVVLVAELDQPTTNDVFVPLVIGSSTLDESDYSLPFAFLYFPAGTTSASVAISLVDDASDEHDESIRFLLGTPVHATLGANSEHTVTVLDNDEPPLVFFTQSSRTFAEDGGELLLRARVSQVSGKEITIPLLFTGTASAADYSLPQGTTLVIPAGSETGTLTVAVTDDSVSEGNETIVVTMQAPFNAFVSTLPGAADSQVVIIPANDAPSVSFTTVYQLRDESAAPFQLQVKLSHAHHEPIEIPFSTSGSTASASDYTISSSPLRFDPGQTEKSITVDVIDDALGELRETLQITLNPPTNVLRGATTRSLVEIEASDIPLVSIDVAGSSAETAEGAFSMLKVRLSNASAFPVFVPVFIGGGTALPSDYQLFSSFITIPGGSLTESKEVLHHVDDDLEEPHKTVTLRIGGSADAMLDPHGTQLHNIRLKNDDFQVRFNSLQVLEGGKGVEVIVGGGTILVPPDSFSLSDYRVVEFRASIAEAVDRDVQVHLTINGSAKRDENAGPEKVRYFTAPPGVPNGDYFIAAGPQVDDSNEVLEGPIQLTIQQGQTHASVWVFVQPDARSEEMEYINVYGYAVGAIRTIEPATIRIADNDAFQVSFATFEENLERIESHPIVIAVNEPAPFDIEVPFTVEHSRDVLYDVEDDSTTVSTVKFVIPAGQQSVTEYLTWEDDSVQETNEKLVVTLGTPRVLTSGQPIAAKASGWTTRTIGVANDDLPNDAQQAELARRIAYPPSIRETQNAIIPGSGDLAAKITYKWKGLDGYISGGTAFFDANHNGLLDFLDLNFDGIQDPNEPSEVSDITASDGSFVLQIPPAFDRNGDGLISAHEGQLVVAGGTDISRNAPQPFALVAPVGSSVVTPLTTLAAALVNQHGLSTADAAQRVREALFLPDVDFTQVDPILATAEGDPLAAEVFAAAAKLQDTLAQAAAVLANLPDAPPPSLMPNLLLTDLAAKIVTPDAELELGHPLVIEAILDGAANSAGLTLDATLRSVAAEVISASNRHIDSVPAIGSLDFLESVARSQVVAQGEALLELGRAARGEFDPVEVQTRFTGNALQLKIAAAEVDTVMPPRLFISDVQVSEAAGPNQVLEFVVSMVGTPTAPVSARFATTDGIDAVQGVDFLATSGTLHWQAGDTSPRIISVPILNDGDFENDEQFLLFIGQVQGAVINQHLVRGTILNDDALVYNVPHDGVASNLLVEIEGNDLALYRNNTLIISRSFARPAPLRIVGQPSAANHLVVRWIGPSSVLSEGLEFVGGNLTDTLFLANGPSDVVLHTRAGALDGHFDVDQNLIEYFGVESAADTFTPRILGLPFLVNEGSSLQATAMGADPERVYAFAWEVDGALPLPEQGTGEIFDFVAADNGMYRVSLTSASNGQTDAYSTQIVHVQNVAPSFSELADETLLPPAAGVLERMAIPFADPGADFWLGTVDFQDGSGEFPLVIDQQNRTFDLNHTFLADGIYDVIVTLLDDDGGSFTDTFQVQVILNTPPVANDDSFEATEDSSVTISPLQNDTDEQNNIVAERTVALTSPAAGVLVNNGDGTFLFDPNSAFESLALGESTQVSFRYQIEDSFGETATAEVRIDIAGRNDSPQASDVAITTNEDAGLFTLDVLAASQASDVDTSDQLAVGSLVQSSGRAISWTRTGNSIKFNTNQFNDLAVGERETLEFDFIVRDDSGAANDWVARRLSITIEGVNDVPGASSSQETIVVDEGQTATNSGSFGDADLSDVVSVRSSIGSIVYDKGNAGTWNWSFNTSDGPDESQTVTITADDGHGGIATTSFALVVKNVAPIVTVVGAIAADEGQTKTYTFTVWDPGVDTFQLVSQSCGAHGVLANATFDSSTGSGSFDCTFTDGAATSEVAVLVADSDGDRQVAPTVLSVTIENVAPMLQVVGNQTVDQGRQLSLHPLATFLDPGFVNAVSGTNETFSYVIHWGDGQLSNGTAAVDSPGAPGTPTLGSVSAAHVYAVPGNYTVTVTVSDDDGGSATQSFGVTARRSIFVLNDSHCASLSVSGNGVIDIDGSLVVNSTCPISALAASGNALVEASQIVVAGGTNVTGNAKLTSVEKPLTTGSVADPLQHLVAPSPGSSFGSVHCSGNAKQTIQPGSYDKIAASGNCELTLAPGTYTITTGGFQVSGNAIVRGLGVLTYVVGGGINLSGNGDIDLTPVDTGPYAGLLLVQPATNTSTVSLSGNATLFDGVKGTIYAPKALTTLSGNSRIKLSVITDRLRVDGNAHSALMSAGRGTSDLETVPMLGAGQLPTGQVTVAIGEGGELFTAEHRARVRDALAMLNDTFQQFGVTLIETASPEDADIRLHASGSSDCGAFADGVLGCATGAGDVTLVVGWDWFVNTNSQRIGLDQYDFQTVVAHEIGHRLGLAHSSDPSSVMYWSLAPGVARRDFAASDFDQLGKHDHHVRHPETGATHHALIDSGSQGFVPSEMLDPQTFASAWQNSSRRADGQTWSTEGNLRRQSRKPLLSDLDRSISAAHSSRNTSPLASRRDEKNGVEWRLDADDVDLYFATFGDENVEETSSWSQSMPPETTILWPVT